MTGNPRKVSARSRRPSNQISSEIAFDTGVPSNEFATSSREAPGTHPATRPTATRSNASPASSLRAPAEPTSARSPALGPSLLPTAILAFLLGNRVRVSSSIV